MRLSLAMGFVTLMALLLVTACAGPAATPTATLAKPAVTATTPPAASPAKPAAASPTAAASGAASPTTAAAATGPTIKVTTDPKLGNILTDANGMTLYTYKNDQPGTSNCYDQCATNWPPLTVTGAPTAPPNFSGKLDTTTRREGTKQVTYNQKPLYYFARDTKPGDTNGQGVGGVWDVAVPNTP